MHAIRDTGYDDWMVVELLPGYNLPTAINHSLDFTSQLSGDKISSP